MSDCPELIRKVDALSLVYSILSSNGVAYSISASADLIAPVCFRIPRR